MGDVGLECMYDLEIELKIICKRETDTSAFE